MATAEPLPTIREYRKGNIDLESATLKVALFDDETDYTIDRVNHEFVSDVLDNGTTANELDHSSYNREPVNNVSVTVDSADEEVMVDGDDVKFEDLDGGETIQGWLIYDESDNRVIAIEDEVRNSNGNPATTNGSDVTIQLDAEGIVTTS